MERGQDSSLQITLDLHKERKLSLLMATGDCSPFLLSSSTLMSISVFEPPDIQKGKKKISLGFTQEIKCRKHSIKIQPWTDSVTVLLLGLKSLFQGDHFPMSRSRTGCAAWKCRKVIFPHAIQNFTLLTRTKGTKRRRAFSDIFFYFC